MVARLCMLAALAVGGAAGCEAVADPEVGSRAAVAAEAGGIGGTVINLEGAPVEGARVRTSSGAGAVTDRSGGFAIGGLAPTERLVVSVEAPGYVPTTKIYQVVAGQTLSRPIRVQPQAAPVAIPAGAGGVVAFGGNGEMRIPANAFEGVAPGATVSVRATYLDTNDPRQLETASGDFTARAADGTDVSLESFGMGDFDVRDANGQRLELAPGQQVEVRFPLRGQTSAPTRGLWSFDEGRGIWVEDGIATASADSTLDVTLTSLRPRKNIDDRFRRVCISVRVFRSDKVTPQVGRFVTATGVSYAGATSGWTNTTGVVQLIVRASSVVSINAGPVPAQQVNTPAAGTPGCPLVATFAY